MQLNINTNELVRFTAKLERINRSALPVAVRSALNKAAFDVKGNTMPAGAKEVFIQRKPTFFKANSKVAPATGFSIESMKATVGFLPKSGNDKSVDDLKQQEEGGAIHGRSFIPLAKARTGGSWNRNVKAGARISDIRKRIVDANKASGASDKEKYIKSAIHAGKGGFVIGTGKNSKGNRTLFSIRSIIRKKGMTIVNSVALFSVKGGREVRPGATHFMEKASLKSARGMDQYFINEAKKQIDKIR